MRLLALDYNSFSFAYSFFIDGDFQEHGIVKNEDMLGLLTSLEEMLREKEVEYVAIEKLYVGLNAMTVAKLADVHGGMVYAALRNGAKVHQLYPTHWKAVTLGTGKATKKQSVARANELLGTQLKDDNIADSLFIGLCAYRELVGK